MTNGLESEIAKLNPLTREHTVYMIGSERVPSVTTVLNNLGWKFPALMGWQAKMLRQGIDPDAAKTDAGTVGTLVHAMIQAYLTNKEVDYQFFSEAQRALAKTAFKGFLDWYDEKKVKPLAVEASLTHTTYRYGGTIDLWCKIGSRYTLIDFKSSTAVYLDHRIQVAAYSELAKHRYNKPHDVLILHLNKYLGVVTPHPYPDLRREREVFLICLKLEKIHKHLK
jgi:ATP-dependent exoDNAse (exonuclease V) beta subunit